jgi:hypothetical protein
MYHVWNIFSINIFFSFEDKALHSSVLALGNFIAIFFSYSNEIFAEILPTFICHGAISII